MAHGSPTFTAAAAVCTTGMDTSGGLDHFHGDPEQPPMTLSMRPTLIGGEQAEGDFTVIHDSRYVGRIRCTLDQVSNKPIWTWNITVPLPMAAWTRGSAESLSAAKDAFRTAWERFYSSLTPEQIARWHHTQDARKP